LLSCSGVEVSWGGGLRGAKEKRTPSGPPEAGAAALNAGAAHSRSLPPAHVMIPPMTMPDATFLDFAAEVKKAVKVPVIAVGRLGDPTTATDAVAGGKADFVALGRTLIAEPEWVAKLAPGEPARRCLACNTCVD